LAISGNTINASVGVFPGDANGLTWGIAVTSVQGTASVALTGNTIGASGGTFDRGLHLWNDGTNLVSVSGGSIGNSRVGIELDAVDPFFGGTAVNGNTTVSVTNV